MKTPTFAVVISILALMGGAEDKRPECSKVAQKLNGTDEEMFHRGLQDLLNEGCMDLLPKVADLLRSGNAPLAFTSALTLALSGQKEYGPVLIDLYYGASLRPRAYEFVPAELREAVLFACSDIPRGKSLQHHKEYRKGVHPSLDDSCIDAYRELLASNADEFVAASAMELLQETSSTNAIDLIRNVLRTGGHYARKEAAVALQYMPLDASEAAFREALRDQDDSIRYQAVRILRKQKDPRVVVLFKERLPLEKDGQLIDMMKNRVDEDSGGGKP